MHRDSNFNSGLLLGALIGGAAALLLSPHSGRKNRAKLQNSLDKARNVWEDTGGDVQATLTTLFKRAQDELTDIDTPRAYFDRTLADAKLTLADLKSKDLDEIIDEVQANFENSQDTEYNDNWVDELRHEWQKATDTTTKTRRTRKA